MMKTEIEVLLATKEIRDEFDAMCLAAHETMWAKGFGTDYEFYKPFEKLCSAWMYEFICLKRPSKEIAL